MAASVYCTNSIGVASSTADAVSVGREKGHTSVSRQFLANHDRTHLCGVSLLEFLWLLHMHRLGTYWHRVYRQLGSGAVAQQR